MDTKEVKAQIKFSGFKIKKLDLNYLGEEDPVLHDNLNFDLSVNSKVNSNNKGFQLQLNISLANQDKKFDILIVAIADFETDVEINEDYLENPMVKINAPSIVFPFIRAFINTLSVNAGYNPIILPAINFVRLVELNEKRNSPK